MKHPNSFIHIVTICIVLLHAEGFQHCSAQPDNVPVTKSVDAPGNRYENYDVKFYKLDLEVSDTSIYLKGSVSMLFEITALNTENVILELVDYYVIDSVISDFKSLNYLHHHDSLIINLSRQFYNGELGEITVYYHGRGYNSGLQNGIYNSKSSVNNKRYTWTLSEPFSAKCWFPCKQVLTDKADSVYVFITTGSHLKAGSNGLLSNKVDLPGNRIRYEWKSRYPIAYYLISFALGDYLDYSFYAPLPEGDSLLIQNYIYNDSAYLAENKRNIDATSEMLDCYSRIFGRYPFFQEKYGHCVVPIGGGMEHQTMTTLSGFSFNLVAHELAHQWFGDYVTCSTWQDIWINEGFASYAEYLALENIQTKSEAVSWMASAHKSVKRSTGGSIFVPLEDISSEKRIFSMVLSYKKGAAILHMIRQEVGNDGLFFSILQEFLSQYQNSHASAEDFKHILELQTQKDFSSFFEQWFYGEGFPRFKINWFAARDSVFICSLQETTSENTPVFNALLEFSVQLPGGKDTLIFFRQNSNYQEFKGYIPYPVQHLIFDPNKWLLANLDSFVNIYDKINPESLYTVTPNPVTDKLNIWFRSEPGVYHYYLVDFAGHIITSSKTSLRHLVIDLKKLSRGNYLLLILKEDRFSTTKIIKV